MLHCAIELEQEQHRCAAEERQELDCRELAKREPERWVRGAVSNCEYRDIDVKEGEEGRNC